MEARRQQALQKKLETDKAQEQRRIKEENERRKREKEELADKKPAKAAVKKVNSAIFCGISTHCFLVLQADQEMKKKKTVHDGPKKTENKKAPLSKEKDPGPSRIAKQGTAANPDDELISAPSTVRLVGEAGFQVSPSAKVKGKLLAHEEESIPMKAFEKQTQSTHPPREQISIPSTTDHIELPDINSEYSDSEDEGRVRTFDPPHWAQSPEIREALQAQSKVNPDDVFGAIKPLRMEEMFKARNSRFRARTSSANWLGSDKLTIAEQLEYNQRMGFQS